MVYAIVVCYKHTDCSSISGIPFTWEEQLKGKGAQKGNQSRKSPTCFQQVILQTLYLYMNVIFWKEMYIFIDVLLCLKIFKPHQDFRITCTKNKGLASKDMFNLVQ